MDRRALNRAASLRGINKETAGEFRNLARRYDRLGKSEDARACREKADQIEKEFPHFNSRH